MKTEKPDFWAVNCLRLRLDTLHKALDKVEQARRAIQDWEQQHGPMYNHLDEVEELRAEHTAP